MLLENVRDELFWLKISCFIFSSIVVFREIFLMTMNWFKNLKEDQRETFKTGNLKIFFVVWIIYILVYISVMILAQYPGNLTSDNIDQITQENNDCGKDHNGKKEGCDGLHERLIDELSHKSSSSQIPDCL